MTCCRYSLLFVVCLSVKVVEHVEKDRVLAYGHREPNHRVAGLKEEQENAVGTAHRELQQLQLGDVLLPPQILLHFRAKGCECVVSVHHHMNQRIEEYLIRNWHFE